MINKTIMTAGAFILSMMVLIAATNVDSLEVSEQDRDHHTLSGVVVDADTEDGVANATVYLKKKNGHEGMRADRTQQQQQQDRTTGQDQDELEQTTTDQNGEFEFDNLEQIRTQVAQVGAEQRQQQQQQQNQQAGEEDDTFVLVVEAEGYETEEKEIKLSEYLKDLGQERGAMERDHDRDDDMDRDRYDEDKDKDKIKIELTRSN